MGSEYRLGHRSIFSNAWGTVLTILYLMIHYQNSYLQRHKKQQLYSVPIVAVFILSIPCNVFPNDGKTPKTLENALIILIHSRRKRRACQLSINCLWKIITNHASRSLDSKALLSILNNRPHGIIYPNNKGNRLIQEASVCGKALDSVQTATVLQANSKYSKTRRWGLK